MSKNKSEILYTHFVNKKIDSLLFCIYITILNQIINKIVDISKSLLLSIEELKYDIVYNIEY